MTDKYISFRVGFPTSEAPRDWAEFTARESNYQLDQQNDFMPGHDKVRCLIFRDREITDNQWDQWTDTFRTHTFYDEYIWRWTGEKGCPDWKF